jgi:hypothetical protein
VLPGRFDYHLVYLFMRYLPEQSVQSLALDLSLLAFPIALGVVYLRERRADTPPIEQL